MNAESTAALRRFLDAGATDPVEGALIVAAILDPTSNAEWVREQIRRIADDVPAKRDVEPHDLVRTMAEHGFHGAEDSYYSIENSVLDHVLRTRAGIPVSLGVVFMGVARQLDLPASGVNFPRHFLVTIGDQLVDPYHVKPTTVEACQAWLRENNVDEKGAFDIAEPKDIVLRMLNNVRLVVHDKGDFSRSLELSDFELMIAPDAYGLYVERADAWLGLDAYEMAVTELENAAARAPDKSMQDKLLERANRARRLKSVVH